MGFFDRFKKKRENSGKTYFLTSPAAYDTLCISGYTPLDRNPEIMTACFKIAQIVSNCTIHLMNNTENGDERIINELSRKIDIDPMPTMTRQHWMTAIVMNLLLYGHGNSIVVPHTKSGLLDRLEPIAAQRVSLEPVANSYEKYVVRIDGIKTMKPDKVLHFVYNPDEYYLWKGKGFTVSLRDLAKNLKQASKTTEAFMKSEYKPSIIVRVDALVDEFSNPQGRENLQKDYLNPAQPGAPWIIPADVIDVEQVKPLTLQDLAISEQVELDKRAVAAILGVPSFVLGVGEYDKEEWNYFVQTTIMSIAKTIMSEMTRKIIIKPSWYLKMNVRSLMDWDIEKLYRVYGGLSDKGLVTGNEVRDILGMSPQDGLDELRILENYLPIDRLGDQKKLIQESE